MKEIELAKYWYYRLKKQWNANNRNDTIHKRIKLLESYLMKYDYIKLGAELPQKDYLILLLRAAKYYGKDYRLYIPQLKSNLFKYLWDTKPDGLRYDEYLKYHEQKSNNSAVINNALKRLHPYAETLRYETIFTPLTEGGNQEDKIFIENGKKYKISLKKREHLVPIYLVPDENILANSYITYSKYPDSIENIELEKLIKQLEPSEKEIVPLIQDILIDQQISINSVKDNELKKKLEEITTQTRKIEDLNSKITRLAIDNYDTNRELEVAHKIIKKQKKHKSEKIISPRIPTFECMRDYIDNSRFKSSNLVNCDKIGRLIGADGETIKRWIKRLGLYKYAFKPFE